MSLSKIKQSVKVRNQEEQVDHTLEIARKKLSQKIKYLKRDLYSGF